MSSKAIFVVLAAFLSASNFIVRASQLCCDGMPPLGNFCSSVLGAKICNGEAISVQIKNVKTGEYIYAAADDWAFDAKRRRVFTWDASVDGNWKGEGDWSIEPLSGIMHPSYDAGSCQSIPVRIKSLRPGANGYLYVDALKSNTTNEAQIFTMRNTEYVGKEKLGLASVWNLRMANGNQAGKNSQYVTIENVAERKYLNGGQASMFATSRRNVFVNADASAEGSVWQIDPL